MLSFSPTIEFGCVCAMRDFQPIGNQSYNHSDEYGVSNTLNVSDLTLFDIGNDLRSNSFKERGDNED